MSRSDPTLVGRSRERKMDTLSVALPAQLLEDIVVLILPRPKVHLLLQRRMHATIAGAWLGRHRWVDRLARCLPTDTHPSTLKSGFNSVPQPQLCNHSTPPVPHQPPAIHKTD